MLTEPPDGSATAVSSPDNGTALTARAFRARLAEHRISHRRGGYRDSDLRAGLPHAARGRDPSKDHTDQLTPAA
jgi:hypothetical protein